MTQDSADRPRRGRPRKTSEPTVSSENASNSTENGPAVRPAGAWPANPQDAEKGSTDPVSSTPFDPTTGEYRG